jgi:chromosome segregation ATPase
VRRRVRDLEKANRALTAARASDEAAHLRLHELTTVSASAQDARLLALEKTVSDQAAQLRARSNALKKVTFSSDQDARLSALEKEASAPAVLTKTSAFDRAELLRHKDALDGVYQELDRLNDGRKGIYKELDELKDRTSALRRDRDTIYNALDHLQDKVRRREVWEGVGEHKGRLLELGARLEELETLRVPISWVVTAEAELGALVVKRDTVQEEGWSWELGAKGQAPASKSDLHHLRLEMYGELLGIRRDLLGLRPRGNGVR